MKMLKNSEVILEIYTSDSKLKSNYLKNLKLLLIDILFLNIFNVF